MIKKIRRIIRVLIVIFVLLFAAKYLVSYFLKPNYQGTIEFQDLNSEVNVYFDDYGIPHIYANNEIDAQRALGYAHAQDRLWQMELLRRIAPGKLSEIFGEKALENDRFFAGLGIEEASIETVNSIDKNSDYYKLANAYLDGVNQFIENGPTPIEFLILGIEKEKFDLVDVYNTFGYMAFSFAHAQKIDPILTNIQAKYGNEYVKELGIDINPNSTLIKNYNKANEQIATAVSNIVNNSPVPAFIGSNSWIVAPEKAKNDKVLFANDPHIGYASPSVWYEAHVHTPTYESYGYYLGGVPFPVLSHNREFAYGLTMFENDDVDFYEEQNHPTDDTKYKFKDRYKNYKTIEKIIKVKDAEDVKLTVKSTLHGPIMNDLITTIDSDKPIAMSWIYTKLPNKGLNALYKMSHAKSKVEFDQGVSLIHAPGLNVMYGDVNDKISWTAAGKLYKLSENVSTKLFLDGASGENEIVEYLDFSQNPQAHNPPWNYVYSTNNQPDSIAGMLYPGYYLPEDRGKRVVELMESKNDWTKEDYMKMLVDSKSSTADELVKIISKNVKPNLVSDKEKEAHNLLENWDGDFVKSSVGATIYNKFTYFFLKNTFEDEIGKEVFTNFINTHVMSRAIALQLEKQNSVWWDDINTQEIKENKSQIITKSFSETVASLEKQLGKKPKTWTWNRVHTVTHNHPFGTVKLLDRIFKFNVGNFEINGSNAVLNNQGFDLTDNSINVVLSGPSTRRIVDFSDIENSVSILPTGNSGNPFSKFYRDQAEMFANGQFRKMKLNKEEIEKVSTKLVMKPKNEY